MRPLAIDILGKVGSLAPARVLVDMAPSPAGPWKRIGAVRALTGTLNGNLKRERQKLSSTLPPMRYCRLYIRREGHASFRHQVHDVSFVCLPEAD